MPPCLQQTKAAEQLIAQESGLERDVGQNLMQMLGGQSDVLGKRRRSSAGSVDSDESALSGRWGPACLYICLSIIRRYSFFSVAGALPRALWLATDPMHRVYQRRLQGLVGAAAARGQCRFHCYGLGVVLRGWNV